MDWDSGKRPVKLISEYSFARNFFCKSIFINITPKQVVCFSLQWLLQSRNALERTASRFVSFSISRSTFVFADKMMIGILSSFISSVSTFAHLHFFCRCIKLIYQTFLKLGRQNCNCLSIKKDEEQILSVHLWTKKRWNFSQQDLF